MAGGIGQYFKDTRSELNHVAWPTRNQTIVYTILVAAISLGVAAYLGLFDYLFTTLLAHAAGALSGGAQTSATAATTTAATTTTAASSTFGL